MALKAKHKSVGGDLTQAEWEAEDSHTIEGEHAQQHAITAVADHTSGATPGKILKADGNGLPVDATNIDGDVADAVAKRHSNSLDHARNADIVIKDADGDTKIQVEESADEDKIRMDVKGVEVFLLSDVGILTLAKQSSAKGRATGDQVIPTATVYGPIFMLDTEDIDTQGGFDSSIYTVIADSTVANKLHKTGAFPNAAADYIGRQIWNITDNTYAFVTAKDSNDQLSINVNIMANGETAKLYFSRFTVAVTGTYLVSMSTCYQSMAAGSTSQVILQKNGVMISGNNVSPGAATWPVPQATLILLLSAGDYLQISAWQNSGVNKSTYAGDGQVFLAVVKIV